MGCTASVSSHSHSQCHTASQLPIALLNDSLDQRHEQSQISQSTRVVSAIKVHFPPLKSSNYCSDSDSDSIIGSSSLFSIRGASVTDSIPTRKSLPKRRFSDVPRVIIADVRPDCHSYNPTNTVILPPLAASSGSELSSPWDSRSASSSSSIGSTTSFDSSLPCGELPPIPRPSSRKRVSSSSVGSLEPAALQKKINALLYKAGVDLQSHWTLNNKQKNISVEFSTESAYDHLKDMEDETACKAMIHQLLALTPSVNNDKGITNKQAADSDGVSLCSVQSSSSDHSLSIPKCFSSHSTQVNSSYLLSPTECTNSNSCTPPFNPSPVSSSISCSPISQLCISTIQADSEFDTSGRLNIKTQFALSPSEIISSAAKSLEVHQSILVSADVLSGQLAALRLHPSILKEGNFQEWNKEKVEVKYKRETRR
jgi:hypothetical protein